MSSQRGLTSLLIIVSFGILLIGAGLFLRSNKRGIPPDQQSQPTTVENLAPEESEARVEKVQYESKGLVLDSYSCKPKGNGPFPAVIYNHGGLGNIVGGDPQGACAALAKAGFVGFAGIRRQTVPLDGHLDDVLASLNYVKKLNYVDKNRLGIIGFSRGGLLTFMAAIHRPTDFKALVLMAPAPAKNTLESYLTRAQEIGAPALILVAENDIYQSNHLDLARKVEQALAATGKKVQLIIYPPYGNDGHELFFEVGSYWPDVLKFLQNNL